MQTKEKPEKVNKVRHAIAMEPDVFEDIKIVAKMRDITTAGAVREAMREYLAAHADELERGRKAFRV